MRPALQMYAAAQKTLQRVGPCSHRSICSSSPCLAIKSLTTTLPPPRSAWSYRRLDLQVAHTNAKLRKAPVTDEEFAWLESVRPRLTDLLTRKHQTSIAIKKAEAQITGQISAKAESKQGTEESESARRLARELKSTYKTISDESNLLHNKVNDVILRLPNLTHPSVPIGGEKKAMILGLGGDRGLMPEKLQDALSKVTLPIASEKLSPLEVSISPQKKWDHLNIAIDNQWMNVNSTRHLAGSDWPLLFGPLAHLEHCLTRYAMEHACAAEYVPIVVPDVVKRDILSRTGFSPRAGSGGHVYWLSSDSSTTNSKSPRTAENKEDLALAATAEIPLAGMSANCLYDSVSDLPRQYVASSHAFRAEAGARGLESKGLYRVHQFTKVELFVLCRPEDSEVWLERLRSLQETLISGLGLPYRVLDMPTEELGASAYRKYDIEVWMPGRGSWGEVTSASNCTDYQSLRLNIMCTAKAEAQSSGNRFVHTLNGTAVAVPRMIVALLENYGVSSEGKLRLPRILKNYWMNPAEKEVEWIDVAPQRSDLSQHLVSAEEPLKAEPANSKRPSAVQSAIAQIRRMSERNGTDPASMVLSFFILHEITAIMPLIILFYVFGLLAVGEIVMSWLLQVSNDDSNGWRTWLRSKIDEGMQRAEHYGRKKGYFGFEEGSEAEGEDKVKATSTTALAGTFANAVAAYAITKALFPLRIGASIALAGPFSRLCIEPVKRLFRRPARP